MQHDVIFTSACRYRQPVDSKILFVCREYNVASTFEIDELYDTKFPTSETMFSNNDLSKQLVCRLRCNFINVKYLFTL